MTTGRPKVDGVNWVGDAYPSNADRSVDTWNGRRLSVGFDRPDEAIARQDVLRAWERWAECNYPQDLGDEGGWTEAMLDDFLAWAKLAVMAADDWTGGEP